MSGSGHCFHPACLSPLERRQRGGLGEAENELLIFELGGAD